MVRETGKRRGSRIELDYYRGSDGLSRWRGRLCLLVILAAAGWLGLEAIASRDRATWGRSFEPSRLASKGPLAQAHAMWDSTCQACHLPFTPINHSRWAPAIGTGSHASDDRCRTCHAAPIHHQSERPDQVPACAECHRDHRGREASLLAMDDSACTRCHGDLSQHRGPGAGTLSVAASVSRFDTAHHPEFTTTPVDRAKSPRRVKFNHARHLGAGLTLETGGTPFSFAQLAPQDRARYGWAPVQTLDLPVRLDCAACHQLDGADQVGGDAERIANRTPARSPGASMLPVVYDFHCAACHPLPFDANVPHEQVPHGLAPAELDGKLRQFYAAQVVRADPAALRQFVPPRPLPDQSAGSRAQRFEDAIEAKVLTAAKLLFGSAVDEATRRQQNLPLGRGGCVECHNLKPNAGPLISARDLASLEIEPVLMTPVWLESAVFNHTAHRALDCAACHAGVSSSRANGDRPLLPGIGVCASCHSAVSSRQTGQLAGASAACTECHRYHNGDHPRHGKGAAARRGAAALSIEQFQSGGADGRPR